MEATPVGQPILMSLRYAVDSPLTARVKDFALSALNADLVGIANIERFENAPLKMSPQGIMPVARSVVVMAVHHPDACIELGGLTHPQDIGPYRVQYHMNDQLDEMSYRMGLFLEEAGYRAVPIVSSNIWRYKGYKELTEHFAPDMSHRHAAVAAGLADFGYSALAISPEYGARQRFVSVVTDAVLTPTPLLEPGSVCDNCMLCREHCLSGALSKELDGWSVVRIEGREYRYVNKNLWRCAWGEHFDLDLDLPIPDRVDEQVILEHVEKHGFRAGEMGSCLRYCVPAPLRYFDPDYTNAPRRRRQVTSGDGRVDRGTFERLRAIAAGGGLDFIVVPDADAVREMGVDLTDLLPDARSALIVGTLSPPDGDAAPSAIGPGLGRARDYLRRKAGYDVCRALERLGHTAVMFTALPEQTAADRLENVPDGLRAETLTVLTSASLPTTGMALPDREAPLEATPGQLTDDLEQMLKEWGADLVGAAPASRFGPIARDLASAFGGEEVVAARDRSERFRPFEPEVSVETRRVHVPEDHLPGCRSVFVIGLRLPRGTVDCTIRTPAEAVGPYAFAQYESANLLRVLAWRACRALGARGFRAAWSFDLMGTGSVVGNPRGEQPDAFCNRFAAVAAGLGRLMRCGSVVTPEYGSNVRFVALMTDAVLRPTPVIEDDSLTAACQSCRRCLDACRTDAFRDPVTVRVGDVRETFHPISRTRCDWAKRYSLVADEGNRYMGWSLDLPAPEEVSTELLADAVRQQPAVSKYRPCNVELCVLACPYAREQSVEGAAE